MRRFCWRERSEKLNWRLLRDLDVTDVVKRGDPAMLEPYALHITFARLPNTSKDPSIRDAWFLVRIFQLSMEYLLFMRARDSDVLSSMNQEVRLMEQERDELVSSLQKWKAKARSGDKQVERLHQVLQNIAKLLQIHGIVASSRASPSAVATIETLLTELISERRAKQKIRAVPVKHGDDGDDLTTPAQEARVCGFCGKLFSSAGYLEKHLVRRHSEKSIAVETPVTHNMRRDSTVEIEKTSEVRRANVVATEATLQKMVQQIEKALHEHEGTLRSLALDEKESNKQMYERLHTEVSVAEKMKEHQLKIEQQNEALKHQLDEMSIEKQQFEEKLGDLKQQIDFLRRENQMMGSSNDIVLPFESAHKSEDALTAAETEINVLRRTLEDMKEELTSVRKEMTKVQALHLSALKKKKELADKLALSRVVPLVERQEMSSQTKQSYLVNKTVQTDEQHNHLPPEISATVQQDTSSQTERLCTANETVQTDESSSSMPETVCLPFCKDVGTNALVWSYADMATQTLAILETPLVHAKAQLSDVDDLEHANRYDSVTPDNSLSIVDKGDVTKKVEILGANTHKEEESVVDYTQQMASQDLLDFIAERAQSAANKVASSDKPVSKNYTFSVSRHKCVRSIFQHDEGVAKERVATCLKQLDQFTQRFGVSPNSARISNDNLAIVKLALRGHLEVLSAKILSTMVNCENSVNAVIEKEWVPMEKARQDALEHFKAKTWEKSELNQGLVRQAMAATETGVKVKQPGDTGSSEDDAVSVVRTLTLNDKSVSNQLPQHDSIKTANADSVKGTARQYSAKNNLTVVVGRKANAGRLQRQANSIFHHEPAPNITTWNGENDDISSFDDTLEVMLT